MDPSLAVSVVVRGTVGARLAESLAVQGVSQALVVPEDMEMSDPMFADALAELNLASNGSIVLFLNDP